MKTEIFQLFHELVDSPTRERNQRLDRPDISDSVRHEVAGLLGHAAAASGETLFSHVRSVAAYAFSSSPQVAAETFGPYRVIRAIGAGGMGTVYLAERNDGEVEQYVAVKVLRSDIDSPSWRERFLQERQMLAWLNHPGIARLLDAGHSEDGRPWLAMEYVEGKTIDEYAADLSIMDKVRLFLDVCDAITYAHTHSVIHRDLKPSNILVDASGRPRLLDFGIAKLLDRGADVTQTAERLLTPAYASPEQMQGIAQTEATDVYSLGAVLTKLVTGLVPKDAGTAIASLPADLASVLRKALEADPKDRYESAELLADDLRAFIEGRPVRARSASLWYRGARFLNRYRVPAAAIAAVALLAASGFEVARRQQHIAQARTTQVRQITQKILHIDEIDSGLHNASQSMRDMVEMSKDLLKSFEADATRDPNMALEVAEAYDALARAEGICIATRQQQHQLAAESLARGFALLQPILARDPSNRRALLLAAKNRHDATIRAASERLPGQVVADGEVAEEYLTRFLDLPGATADELDLASEIFYDLSLTQKNFRVIHGAIINARRAAETGQNASGARVRVALATSLMADLLRVSGRLDQSVTAIDNAHRQLESTVFRDDRQRRDAWSAVLSREARILNQAVAAGLRPRSEPAAALTQLFDLLDDWSRSDGGDAWSRMLFAPAGNEVLAAFGSTDPVTALRMFDQALGRVREVRDNTEARLGEAELLCGSADVLRRLNRLDEAGKRVQQAVTLLEAVKADPRSGVINDEVLRTVQNAQSAQAAATRTASRHRSSASA